MAVKNSTGGRVDPVEKAGIVKKTVNNKVEIERAEVEWDPNKVVEKADEAEYNSRKLEKAWRRWHEEVPVPKKHQADGQMNFYFTPKCCYS